MGSPSSTLTPAASSPLLKNWLTESAKLIAQSGRTVEWVTPLGLPIIQPYYRSRSTVVSVQCEVSRPTLPVPRWEQGKDSWARARQVGITGGWACRAGRISVHRHILQPHGSLQSLECVGGLVRKLCGSVPLRQLGHGPFPALRASSGLV